MERARDFIGRYENRVEEQLKDEQTGELRQNGVARESESEREREREGHRQKLKH